MTEQIQYFDNIYELWYEWLKTTSPKTWSRQLKRTLIDCEEPFPKWWEECKEFFLPAMDTQAIWKLDDPEEAAWFLKEGYPLIAINEYSPADRIIKEVRKLLRTMGTARSVGRPAFQDDGDVFTLAQRPDLQTLQALSKMLAVYKMWRLNVVPGEKPGTETNNIALWEIGERLGLTPSSRAEEPKRAMTATVSRYIKWAKTLRKNIIKGKFPAYKEKKEQ